MIQVKQVEAKERGRCHFCDRDVDLGDVCYVWGVRFDEEFVVCYHHKVTKLLIVESILNSYGYQLQFLGRRTYKIYRWDGRNGRYSEAKNPASPSYLQQEDLLKLYDEPTFELLDHMIKERRTINKYLREQVREELAIEAGRTVGVERRFRILAKNRHCQKCGVSEEDMVKKNPKYTLCKGLCVTCYRKAYWADKNKSKEETVNA